MITYSWERSFVVNYLVNHSYNGCILNYSVTIPWEPTDYVTLRKGTTNFSRDSTAKRWTARREDTAIKRSRYCSSIVPTDRKNLIDTGCPKIDPFSWAPVFVMWFWLPCCFLGLNSREAWDFEGDRRRVGPLSKMSFRWIKWVPIN